MNTNSFSIVIPLFNRAHTILRALRSVIAQTHNRWEVIVVDDGSTDNGAAVAERVGDPRIRVIRQGNAGVSAARNAGIYRSTEEFIAFLDADDTWEPRYLASLNDLINNFPNMGAYATSYFLKYPGRSQVVADVRDFQSGCTGGVLENYFKVAAQGSNPLWTGSTCIPRSILIEMRGFPEGVFLHEDLYLWAKVAMEYPIAFCPTPLATYFKFEEDGTCLNRVVAEKDFLFFEYLEKILEECQPTDERRHYIRKYLNQWSVRDAVKAAAASNSQMARACLAMYRPLDRLDHIKLKCIGLYLRIPESIQRNVRKFGRRLKNILRPLKYTATQAPR